MGVLTDYFRAPGDDVVRALDGEPALDVFDGVALKGIDDHVVLGQLVAFAAGRPYRTGLTGSRLIYPDDPSGEGPWVTRLGDSARDVLAAVPAGRVASLAEQWAGIEEFGGHWPAGQLLAPVADLVALAARAR